MDQLDWWLIVGYVFVAAMFTWTFYLTINGVQRKNGDDITAFKNTVNMMICASIGALWPITLPICMVLATVTIMTGRKR